MDLQSAVLLNTWLWVTAGTSARRDRERIPTLNSWAFFHHSLPFQGKYLPETLPQEAEACIGEKGRSSATLPVMAVFKVLSSPKEINLLRYLSCGRTDILVIIESPTKNGHKCVLLNSAIKGNHRGARVDWRSRSYSTEQRTYKVSHQHTRWAAGRELPPTAVPELPAAVGRQQISNTKGMAKVIHAIRKSKDLAQTELLTTQSEFILHKGMGKE